ncbi:hypothetical protein PAHAL_4G299100 [Panicum hallii]|uniref:Trimethylguanosine synthase n=1 Tax=Panicum hallii TaxID=206008 RepID=A0A2S3HMB6_9POAL|nr:trimethylguanosine synthase-like [Panicum hallii]PAN26116.2 hypothetical protein PAHAL_4G299100 [Panicum hallii]
MAKTNAAPPGPGRRTRVLPFLHNRTTTHRFFRLLDATATKTARRRRRRLTARPTRNRRATRPGEPKRPGAAEEPQDQAVGAAREPDAAAEADVDAAVVAGKYWAHRHSLFSLYDRGVRMDAEGWYSATPEAVAASQAARAAPGDLVVDAFAGCGGNSIQFAARGCYVVAVEIDPRKVELAAHNARVYGVEDRIEFVVGDFFRLAPFLKADLVFLSPPWGGPAYIHAPIYTLDMLKPKDGYTTFQAAQKIAPNAIMFLPRTVDISQVEELSWLSCPPLDFESEENYIHHRLKGITAYFGRTAGPPSYHCQNWDDEQAAD